MRRLWCLALLGAFEAAAALPPVDWVPVRWHSADPQSLDLLTGTPFNCLLLEPPAWKAEFLVRAHARNHVIVAVLRSSSDLTRLDRNHVDAVLIEGRADPSLSAAARATGLLTIELPNRSEMKLDSRDPIIGTSQALWPGVEAEHNGKTVLGPTSTPWIHTNGGFLRFVRASSDAVIWLGVRPPPRTIYPVERYAQAIGDAALAGARWVVALDDDLDDRLRRGDPAALSDWRKIAAYQNYFEQHREWREYRPYSRLAVIQSPATGGLLSGSLLDMLASQKSSVRVIPPDRLKGESLRDAKVLLDVDPESLSAEQRRAIAAFVERGGILVDPPSKWKFPAASDDRITLDRRQANELQTLWEVTYNATVRKNFGARTFNTAGILSSVLASSQGDRVLVHLVNFLDFPGESITIHVLGKWKKATVYRLGQAPETVPVFDVAEGTGVELEKLTLIATVRLE